MQAYYNGSFWFGAGSILLSKWTKCTVSKLGLNQVRTDTLQINPHEYPLRS